MDAPPHQIFPVMSPRFRNIVWSLAFGVGDDNGVFLRACIGNEAFDKGSELFFIGEGMHVFHENQKRFLLPMIGTNLVDVAEQLLPIFRRKTPRMVDVIDGTTVTAVPIVSRVGEKSALSCTRGGKHAIFSRLSKLCDPRSKDRI